METLGRCSQPDISDVPLDRKQGDLLSQAFEVVDRLFEAFVPTDVIRGLVKAAVGCEAPLVKCHDSVELDRTGYQEYGRLHHDNLVQFAADYLEFGRAALTLSQKEHPTSVLMGPAPRSCGALLVKIYNSSEGDRTGFLKDGRLNHDDFVQFAAFYLGMMPDDVRDTIGIREHDVAQKEVEFPAGAALTVTERTVTLKGEKLWTCAEVKGTLDDWLPALNVSILRGPSDTPEEDHPGSFRNLPLQWQVDGLSAMAHHLKMNTEDEGAFDEVLQATRKLPPEWRAIPLHALCERIMWLQGATFAAAFNAILDAVQELDPDHMSSVISSLPLNTAFQHLPACDLHTTFDTLLGLAGRLIDAGKEQVARDFLQHLPEVRFRLPAGEQKQQSLGSLRSTVSRLKEVKQQDSAESVARPVTATPDDVPDAIPIGQPHVTLEDETHSPAESDPVPSNEGGEALPALASRATPDTSSDPTTGADLGSGSSKSPEIDPIGLEQIKAELAEV